MILEHVIYVIKYIVDSVFTTTIKIDNTPLRNMIVLKKIFSHKILPKTTI